jgi:hypothetical protein
MASKITKYSLKDFEAIVDEGFDIDLPEDTLQKISAIAAQVGSPTYVRTPDFSAKAEASASASAFASGKAKTKKRNKNMESVSDQDWENLRGFETTKIEVTDAMEASVRRHLNMLTDKNGAETEEAIIALLHQEEENKEQLNKVSNMIFEVASGNKFFSRAYATLYTSLIRNFSHFQENLDESFVQFKDKVMKIKYIDSKEDYERFCRMTKEVDKRQALSSFYWNMMNLGVISKGQIVEIIAFLLNEMNNLLKIDNKKYEVDEIAENVGILLTKEIVECEELEDVEVGKFSASEYIELISSSKTKSFKSLTNKTLFKFMDLSELF